MILKDVVENLVKIENKLDVTRLTYKNVMVWPLLRILLGFSLRAKRMLLRSPGRPNAEGYQRYMENYRRLMKGFATKFRETAENSILFYSYTKSEYININEKYYNMFLDPFKEFLDSQGIRHLGLESYKDTMSPSLYKNEKISELLRLSHKPTPVGGENRLDLEALSSEYLHFEEVLKEMKLDGYWPEAEVFVEHCECFFSIQAMFEGVLKVLSPKACFLQNYFTLPNMALIRACNQLGIKSVEIQHGAQYQYNSKYSHWTRLPEKGFDMLPNYFWCWGKSSTERLSKWFDKVDGNHIAVNGGNLWLQKNLDPGFADKYSELQNAYLDNLEGKKILVTMQPPSGAELFPRILMDAIDRSPADFKWLLRLHPLLLRNQPENCRKLEEIIASRWSEEKVEMKKTSGIPLYSLLRRVDYLVTPYSSVSIEAEFFNVPTIILHSREYDHVKEEVDKGYFMMAETGDQLVECIKKNRKPAPRPEAYAETDEAFICAGFAAIQGNFN
ncbi:MAG: UDP-N-acetyl glucosamine 2-epimerase [bacterium]|nr:UDP-N-acetyl glucosamine 2-epimerase [bacterium]